MRSFYHAGDIGDVIYSLYAVRALGGDAHLTLGTSTGLGNLQPRTGITREIYVSLVPLLNSQPYISRLDWSAQPPFASYDLNEFRYFWRGAFNLSPTAHLLEMYCARFDIPFDAERPWLTSNAIRASRVVFARSPRQRNWNFPWKEVVARFGNEAVFVGTPGEFDDFRVAFDPAGRVHHFPTPHIAALASVINGCDLFIGNSSMPLALAEGLKKNVVQEISLTTNEQAHTRIERKGAVNWLKSGDWQEVGL